MRIKVLFISLLVGLFTSGVVYVIIKQDLKCDEHVVLDDGSEYDCRSVSSFSNGMSTINLCDGNRFTVPTNRIKMVTQK
jgi:hypothetical protein